MGTPGSSLSVGCCSRLALFLVIYTGAVGSLVAAHSVWQAHWRSGGVAEITDAYLVLLAITPPLVILVFLARTFGSSIDRCQAFLTWFTAVLWMGPLLVLIYSVLAPLGVLRAAYSIDPGCRECYADSAGGLCSANCALPPGMNASSACAAGGVPKEWDAEPLLGCMCSFRHIIMAYFRAGFLEESLKFISVYTIHSKPYVADPTGLVLYAAAAGCGFATAENLQYVLMSAADPSQAAQVAVGRAMLAIPMHAGSAVVIGAMLARKRFVGRKVESQDLGFFRIIWLPVLFHGTYDWFQFAQPLPNALLNNLVAPLAIVALTWCTARHEFTLVDRNPIVGPIPRVDVRHLERDGIIPRASFRDCLCHNWLCFKCGGESGDMRLTLIQHADARLRYGLV